MDGGERAATHRSITHPFEVPPGPGEVVEVAQGILWARMPLPMRLDHVNVYLLDDGDGWSVVDTGFDSSRVRAAWSALLEGPLRGKPVRRVIVTHHHPDHIGLAGWFQQAMGAELWTTRTAWLFARMLRLDVQERPTTQSLEFWRGAGMPAEMLAERATSRPMNYVDMVAELPLGFQRISQGQELQIGGRRWRAEIGHGHAPEQATLWGIDHDLLLTGDQILPRISPNLGVYATEPEADPVGDYTASCARFLPLAREEHLALPGHQLPFRGVPGRLARLIRQQGIALERLCEALEKHPRTAVECFGVLYGREIGAGEYGLALVEAVGHLNHLRARGLVSRERREDGAWEWRAAR